MDITTGVHSAWRRRPSSAMDAVGVMVVVGLLGAMVYPALGRVNEQQRASACLSNLHHIGQALLGYVEDFDQAFPMNRFPDASHPAGACTYNKGGSLQPEDNLQGSSYNWKRAIAPYIRDRGVWLCASNAHCWDAGGYNGMQNFGDETNVYYPSQQRWIPISYALNGSFFHEAVPPCWMGEKRIR